MRYALEPGGRRRLDVSLTGRWVVRLRLDDREIGAVEGRAALAEGRDFALDDGSVLRVRLVKGRLFPRLEITRDGAALPGSPTDPGVPLRFASISVFLLAGFTLLNGALAVFTDLRAFARYDYTQAVAAAVYAVLGALVLRGSFPALLATAAIVTIEGAWTILLLRLQGYGWLSADIALRVLVLLNLAVGLAALLDVRRVEPRR